MGWGILGDAWDYAIKPAGEWIGEKATDVYKI